MGTLHGTRLGIIGLVACLLGLPVASTPQRADAGLAVTITWATHERTLADGRTYFVRAPACSPADAPECVSYLGRKRALIVWFHAAFSVEDVDTARLYLESFHWWSRDTVFAFAVSRNASLVWDAGNCCANNQVDELGYLAGVVDDVAGSWTIDRARVGAAGFSNGGMMAERAACERPGLVVAASSVAGTYGGPCDAGTPRIGQWHGALDQVVPINGGQVWINGAKRTFPPAATLGQRMVRGSLFEVRIRPGRGHHLPWTDLRESIHWLVAQLAVT